RGPHLCRHGRRAWGAGRSRLPLLPAPGPVICRSWGWKAKGPPHGGAALDTTATSNPELVAGHRRSRCLHTAQHYVVDRHAADRPAADIEAGGSTVLRELEPQLVDRARHARQSHVHVLDALRVTGPH